MKRVVSGCQGRTTSFGRDDDMEIRQESLGTGLMKKFHMSYMNSFLP